MVLEKVYTYFIPVESRKSEGDDFYEAKTVVQVALSVVVIILLFFLNRVRLNGLFSLPASTLLIASVFVLMVPFYMKLTGSLRGSTILLVLVLMALIMVLTFITGGPFSPSLMFIPAFPMGGIMFVGYRFGLYIAAVFAGYLVFLSWAYISGNLPDPALSDSALALLYVTCTIATAVVFGILGSLYLSWQRSMRGMLEKASNAKTDFLSGMSHELRTPLNSIMGFSDLLKQGLVGNVSNKQREYIGNIFDSSKHMLMLVNDLLDIAKIESGEIEFVPEEVELGLLIDNAVHMIEETAAMKNIEVNTEIGSSVVEQKALLDEMKFKQILLNLLSNAIKFSPEHSTVYLRAGINDEGIAIIVKDEGNGISMEESERIFQKFYQADSDHDIKAAGTGLGLPISRVFAELHGGTLELQCDEGVKGASFLLTVPLRTVDS